MRTTPERKSVTIDLTNWKHLLLIGLMTLGGAKAVETVSSWINPDTGSDAGAPANITEQPVQPIIINLEFNAPPLPTATPTEEATQEATDEVVTEATEEITVEATQQATPLILEMPSPQPTEVPVTDEPTPEVETLDTGMETSPGTNSYLLNFPITSATDLVTYHNLVTLTNQTNGNISPDFLFDQILSGNLDIVAGNTVDRFGMDIPWDQLEAMELSVNTAFTEESRTQSQEEFEFQPLVFSEGAFDHPATHWNIDPETQVQQFAYIAHDYDNAMTVMVLAAAGRQELQMGSENWSRLSEQERINLAVDLYSDWILRTRDSVEAGSRQRSVVDENNATLFSLYFPDQGYRTRRIEMRPEDSRDEQEGAPFSSECVRIQFQDRNNVETPFNEFSRNGDFLVYVVFDPSTNRDRVVVFDLSTAYRDVPDNWQIGEEPEPLFEEGDFINPMEPGCAPAPVEEAPPVTEVIPPPENPSCEETGTCDEPTCEELNNCETPTPTPTPEKQDIGETNPDGATEEDMPTEAPLDDTTSEEANEEGAP